MLEIENYEGFRAEALRLVINSRRNPLQLSKYYLGQWGKFEKNISTLSDIELSQAKDLFTALKRLSEDERSFLATKYRAIGTGKQAILDKEAAELYNMIINDYVKLRTGVEYKFFCHLAKGSPAVKSMID